MARGLMCTAISAAASAGKVGVGAARAGLELALLPARVVSQVVGTVGDEGKKLMDRADRALDDTSRKCGI